MTDDHTRNDRSITAGEYVLGTLSEKELHVFEQQLLNDEQLQQEVEQWQYRLAPMLLGAPEPHPPAWVWENIERKITPNAGKGQNGLWNNLFFWRTLGLTTAVAALLLTFTILTTTPGIQQHGSMLVVMNDQSEAGWIINRDRQAGALRVTAIDPTPMPEGKVCRLWIKSSDNNLQTLGTLPDEGWKLLTFPQHTPVNSQLMISIEDMNQTPAFPTGNIIFNAPLTKI